MSFSKDNYSPRQLQCGSETVSCGTLDCYISCFFSLGFIENERDVLFETDPPRYIMAMMNDSIISPLIQNGRHSSQAQGLLSSYLACWNGWQVAATILFILMAYDQCMSPQSVHRLYVAANTLLVLYIKRKGSIAGPMFKIPFMGPFIQALYPKFDEYLAQWASGPLSCVSVFHKFVVLASDRDIAHKVFKSPAYAKPCLVPIATEIMGPKAWVFLGGRAHAEFRRGLTGLFTNQALSTYLPVQERVYSGYFDKFVAASESNKGKPMEFMGLFREINCALMESKN